MSRVGVLLGSGLGAGLGSGRALAADPIPMPAEAVLPLPQAWEPGVWFWAGAAGDAQAGNAARTGNMVLLGHPKGSLLWNTGPSPRHGRALRQFVDGLDPAVAGPIRVVVLAHAAQDLIFGASALTGSDEDAEPQQAELWMSVGAEALMRQRCSGCLERLTALLGARWMAGAALPRPHRLLEHGQKRVVSGMVLYWHDAGWSASPGSAVVWVPERRLWLGGDTLITDRLISLADAHVPGWLTALQRIEDDWLPNAGAVRSDLPPLWIPDHGSVLQGLPAIRAAVAHTRAYLQDLDAALIERLDAGTGLLEVLQEGVDLPAYRNWTDYARIHPRNVQHRFLQLERGDLQAPVQEP